MMTSKKSRRFKPKKCQPNGITLIEVLVTVSIVSFLMLAMLSLYVAGQRYFLNGSARSDVLRDNRHVLNYVSRDVQEAIQVMPSWDVYTTSTDCLILQVSSIDSNGLIIDIDSQFDYIVYRLNSEYPNRLERIIDANDGVSYRTDSSKTIATRVSSFQLSSGGVDLSAVSSFDQVSSVDITLVTTQSQLDRTFQETLKTGVKLRNKSN
jgi:prepilin-type N-terminal cleavage/methylation domain-containing protein